MAEALTVTYTAQPGDQVSVAGTGFTASHTYTPTLQDVSNNIISTLPDQTTNGTGVLAAFSVPIPDGLTAGTYHAKVDTATVNIVVDAGPNPAVRSAFFLDWGDGYLQGPYDSTGAASDARAEALELAPALGRDNAGPSILKVAYTVVVGTDAEIVLPGEN